MRRRSKNKRNKARLDALERKCAPPPPIRLLLRDDRVEEIQVPDEDDLAFMARILHDPFSREADLICDAVRILQQPGHFMELLQGKLKHWRDILRGDITPKPVEQGLCTREQYCGIEPLNLEELEARKRALFQDDSYLLPELHAGNYRQNRQNQV